MIKKIFFAFAFLIVAIGVYVFYIFYSTGFFREIKNSFQGTVLKKIPISGPEDLQINYGEDFMVISSDDRARWRNGEIKQGHLYYIDLTDSLLAPIQLTKDLKIPFFPHGISMFSKGPHLHKIFVINHVIGEHSIEVFELRKDSLTHLETMKHPSMISPNDLVAIDENAFYFTNDHGYTEGIGKFGEEYLGWSVSNVVFFNGTEYREVADRIAYANGINLDAKRNLLFVASPRDFLVKVYQPREDGSLTFIEDIDCKSGVDNIEFAPDGKIWIGSHPNLLAFTAYATGNKPYSPSEIIRIDYRKPGDYNVDVVFLDDGKEVSASTVAAVYHDLIFIGNVMDDHLLVLKQD